MSGPDPKTTFGWFVKDRYLPDARRALAQNRQRQDDLRINRYLVEYFKDRSLEEVTQFELQIHLNRLAKDFSDSIVRHAFSNAKSILRTARKMKFIVEDPAEDLRMPDTRTVKTPRSSPGRSSL